jgi:hypothetical protein
VLATSQALFTAIISIDMTLTGLTGYQLAPEKSLATLPFALIIVSGAVMTIPSSMIMRRRATKRLCAGQRYWRNRRAYFGVVCFS